MPLDIFCHIVGGRLVKRGENPREIFIVKSLIQKVGKAKTAIQEKQREGENGFSTAGAVRAAKELADGEVRAEKYLQKRREHGEQIGDAQGAAKEIQAGGDAVGQKRIG